MLRAVARLENRFVGSFVAQHAKLSSTAVRRVSDKSTSNSQLKQAVRINEPYPRYLQWL